jgi:1,4-dihydroxy-2-naphthoyl-CoA synthase
MLRDTLRRFIEEDMPRASFRQRDRARYFPREAFSRLASLGVCGLTIDEAYGGLGRDIVVAVVKVVILRADGRGCCAGIDTKALAAEPGAISQVNRGAFDLFAAIHHCPLPVISAVHGYAPGAGDAMAGASDVVIAAEAPSSC